MVQHDAQYDFFGTKLVTCSSDGKIQVYDATKADNIKKIATFDAHNGPIWTVRWCHPMYGSYIASGSFDKQVIVWNEIQPFKWHKCQDFRRHTTGSVNTLEWCPEIFGMRLVAGCSDGSITLFSRNQYEDVWAQPYTWSAHTKSVNSVSWAPVSTLGELDGFDSAKMVLASGGSDFQIHLWEFVTEIDVVQQVKFIKKQSFTVKSWVRSMQFAPSIDEEFRTLAVATEDCLVLIYQIWPDYRVKEPKQLVFTGPCWKVAWSPLGNQIAVTCGNNTSSETTVQVFQQIAQGDYKLIENIPSKF